MTVDLEAIARRTQCELTSLKSALPLLEQGYTPPFLARYRRDELGGLGESAMWSLFRALREDAWINNRRKDLLQRLEQMPQVDPAISRAVHHANSKRVIDRLARRVRSESGESNSPAKRVAARILSPEQGDPGDLAALVTLMGFNESELPAIESALDAALVNRLTVHPQMQNAAVKWLFNHAKIRILSVSDSHLEQNPSQATGDSTESGGDVEASDEPLTGPSTPSSAVLAIESAPVEVAVVETPSVEVVVESASVELAPDAPEQETQNEEADETSADDAEAIATWPTPEELVGAEQTIATEPATEADGAEISADSPESTVPSGKPKRKSRSRSKSQSAPKTKESRVVKKISPRQRRRRWLVTVLQPLAGKEFLAQKLTAFQTLMIGRGLRSGVVQCQFVYDVDKLAGHLQRTAESLNQSFAAKMHHLVDVNDAVIREASEAAWWDELLESSATRLVSVAADHLDSQINRSGVEAKIVLSIDAMGPRTAAIAIVAADGRLLHTEDIPCQLTTALRSVAVTRLGELIHQYSVDLIVVSNGPARRGCLVILHELVEQSPPDSIRWTIAERSGADVYAGSELGNREMRATPRRFRSAAWLAFSVLRPSQAVTKVDPMRLRLGSFQRELSEEALWPALCDVMTSGVSRGGVDVNSAPVDWLAQLPGVTREIATSIDKRRRESLFTSRSDVAALPQWLDPVGARQAIAFLRVFGSSEPLDGTLIHPDDYALAKKLATALKLELPPATPPGYDSPKFDETAPLPSTEPTVPESKVEEIIIDYEATENFASDIQPNEETVTEASQPEAMVEPVAEVTPEPSAADSPASDVAIEPEPAATQSESPAVIEIQSAFRQPLPDAALINKCIKEWQVGAKRVRNVVDALCNPFGDEDQSSGGAAHAVMTRVPKLAELKVGDEVIGVVVGVTEFGAFVELSPECSGLVHVSRVADRFVEDLHEAVQVGDVITAWVTNVEAKRRRVGLSAISPQREQELDRQRQERRDESANYRGQGYGSRTPRTAQNENRTAGPRGDSRRPDSGRSAAPASGGQSGSNAGGSPLRSGESRGRTDSRPDAGGGRGDSRGGSGRGAGGRDTGGRDTGGRGGSGRSDGRSGGGRGGRRERDDRDDGPSSYSTKVARSDTPAVPISEAMASGDEPLRSFGDLMQFFKKAQPEPVVKPKEIQPVAEVLVKAVEVTQVDVPSDNQTSSLASDAPPSIDAPIDGVPPES